MPDGGQRTGVDHLPDGVQAAGQLRGEGDHPHGACGQQPGHRGPVGLAQQPGIVRAGVPRAEPRALQVDAGEHAVADQLGQRRHRTLQPLRGVGDQAGQQRRRAVARWKASAAAAASAPAANEAPPPPCTCRSTKPGTTVPAGLFTSAGAAGSPAPQPATRPWRTSTQPGASTRPAATTVPALSSIRLSYRTLGPVVGNLLPVDNRGCGGWSAMVGTEYAELVAERATGKVSDAVRREIGGLVGPGGLITEPAQLRTYECDGLTGTGSPRPWWCCRRAPRRWPRWCGCARASGSRSSRAAPGPGCPAGRCRSPTAS